MNKFVMTLLGILFFMFGLGPMHVCKLHANTPDIRFCSQASQDEFVHFMLYRLLNKQDPGYYLEIGAWDPIEINNTYFFEKKYGWKGISLDISDQFLTAWHSQRQNALLIKDATRTNYNEVLLTFPREIDYLSLDIDGNYPAVLKRIPFDRYIFKVITIEHDFYRFGNVYRKEEREILSSLGYYLLCPDVSMSSDSFEDWWIYPACFPIEMFATFKSLDLKGKQHNQIISILKSVENSLTR